MQNHKLKEIIFAALLTALTAVATMVIKFPTPTMGYIHLGDGMVLLCGVLLGPWTGAAAAGIGSMLADLLSGYAAWVPGTLVIKAATAMVCGFLFHRIGKRQMAPSARIVLCGVPAELLMAAGYFLYEIFLACLSGSAFGAAAASSLAGVPFNLLQGAVGIFLGVLLLPILSRSSTEMKKRLYI